ncbi:MAG: PCRF domain-containing protein, partial [Defluviitaleaceae bacterium]|nr:PCRF domain-containing protein [Defluviitaleaceae bacterium]
MFHRLEEIETKHQSLAERVNDPATIADQDTWRALMKEYSDLAPIVETYREYKTAKTNVEESKQMLNDNLDDDFRQLVKEELKENQELIETLSTR